MKNLTAEQREEISDLIEKTIPHGSGIDAKWKIRFSETGHRVICWNSYHQMDENGYYDGWRDFRVHIDLERMRIRLVGGGARNSDYLFDTLNYWFSEIRVSLMGLTGMIPIPPKYADAIQRAIHAWRVPMMGDVTAEYAAQGMERPEWLQKISDATNEISLYIDRMRGK